MHYLARTSAKLLLIHALLEFRNWFMGKSEQRWLSGIIGKGSVCPKMSSTKYLLWIRPEQTQSSVTIKRLPRTTYPKATSSYLCSQPKIHILAPRGNYWPLFGRIGTGKFTCHRTPTPKNSANCNGAGCIAGKSKSGAQSA